MMQDKQRIRRKKKEKLRNETRIGEIYKIGKKIENDGEI